MVKWLDEIKWTGDGLVPVIAQEEETGKVLMLAWMNHEALKETVATGKAVYWSRSRKKLWRKGESSGHEQIVKSISLDCDADAVLLQIEQRGGIACHTGRKGCFYRRLQGREWVDAEPVIKDPSQIYGER